MDEIFLIFAEIVFVYPGAFVRWVLFYRKTKTIKEVAVDDMFKNSSIGVLVFVFVAGIIYSVIR